MSSPALHTMLAGLRAPAEQSPEALVIICRAAAEYIEAQARENNARKAQIATLEQAVRTARFNHRLF